MNTKSDHIIDITQCSCCQRQNLRGIYSDIYSKILEKKIHVCVDCMNNSTCHREDTCSVTQVKRLNIFQEALVAPLRQFMQGAEHEKRFTDGIMDSIPSLIEKLKKKRK